VAGKGAEWLSGKYPNVDYIGFVPDATEFMKKVRVVAIPTLQTTPEVSCRNWSGCCGMGWSKSS
jgi:hypothetical protein